MLKWVVIIGVLALIFGGLLLAGVFKLAVGLVKLIFFLAIILIVLALFRGWIAGRKGR